MATAGDFVTRALRLAKVIGGAEVPKASEMTDGIDDFNDMMFAWENVGLRTNWSRITSTDEVIVPDSFVKAMRLSLACELAPQYGVDIGQIFIGNANLAVAAQDEKDALKSILRQHRVVSTDLTALTNSAQSYGRGWGR